ncbi:MAG: hypothetical protein ACXWXQ_03600 [Actinomycetota bacterium]
MAISIDDATSAEPSSDFPTDDDCGPCSRMPRGAALGGTIGVALALGLIGFLIGRARARRAAS